MSKLQRISAIAVTEYRQFVYTKTFWFSILLVPVILLISAGIGFMAASSRDFEPRRVLVVDQTNVLLPALLDAAETRNETGIFRDTPAGPQQTGAPFIPVAFQEAYESPEALELALSEQIRAGEAFAFLIIDAGALEDEPDSVRYHAQNLSYQALPDWIERTIRDSLSEGRLTAAGIDPAEVRSLRSDLRLEAFELAEVTETGEVIEADRANRLLVVLAPMGAVMILFFCITISSPVLLNSVIEEKMGKIAEVLLAAVSPVEIMWGKLVAAAMITLTLAVVYVTPTFIFLIWQGVHDALPPIVLILFPLFLLLGLFSFGGMWAAIGAICAELKDAQNFATIPFLLLFVPFFLAISIVESPDAPFARIMSLIPPFTLFLMPVRLAILPGPPLWEVVLGFVLCALFAGLTVWLASRLFKKGLLETERTPGLGAIWRWLKS